MTNDAISSRRGKTAVATTGLVAAIIAALTLYLCTRYAWASIFSIFMDHDDEGSLLLVLSNLAKGHSLYDQVFTQYGPIAFLPKLAMVKLFGLHVDHDLGRMLTLICWILTSAFSGVAAWRLGRSPAWFAVGAFAVCLTIFSIVNEPGHPQDIISVFLSAAVAVAALVTNRKWQMILLGSLSGLLIMTKINMGAFYLVALGGAILGQLPRGIGRKCLTALAFCVAIALPVLLMQSELQQQWAQLYIALVGVGFCICLVIAGRTANESEIKYRDLLICLIAFAVMIVAIVIATMCTGTSLAGLANGIFVLSRKTAGSFRISSQIYGWTPVLLAGGFVLAMLRNSDRLKQSNLIFFFLGAIRIAAGGMFLEFVRQSDKYYVLAFNCAPLVAWLVMLPVRPAAGKLIFARDFLAFLSIAELLGPYPVFGNQLSFAIFLPAICATICLADGICDLTSFLRRKTIGRGIRYAAQLGILLELFRFGGLICVDVVQTHNLRVSLDLPGAEMIRLEPGEAAGYQNVTANLRRNCDIFYTLPGRNSFYFWTQMEPPTTANSQQWMYLLSDKEQMETIHALDSHPDACLLRNTRLIEFWTEGRRLPDGPLVEYFRDNFRLGYQIGDEEYWFRKTRKKVVEINLDGSETPITLLPR